MSLRRILIFASGLAGLAGPAASGREVSLLPPVVGASEVFESDVASGLALSGYDPVTYYLPQGPKPGRADFEILWGGVAWRFASEANQVAFAANPAAFAPRIGGYDAEAASRGRVVEARTDLYLVRGERLYLFRSDATRARFLADETIARKSEERWLALKDTLVQ
jgi:hypothetical protein